MQRGPQETQHPQLATAITLPNALVNYKSHPVAWKAIQNILNPTEQAVVRNSFYPNIHQKMLCSLTGQLMYDPIVVKDKFCERESYIEWSKNNKRADISTSKLKPAVNVSLHIIKLIRGCPELQSIQYLPRAFINEVSSACVKGDAAALKALQKRDRRLLLTPHPDTKLLPLHQAVVNDVSLTTVIQLLDYQYKGMALACLLQPDASGRLPIEIALRSGRPMLTLLKIMSWMGDTLNSVQLSSPLPPETKPLLNDILCISLLRGNVAWVEAALSWGADIHACPKNNPEFFALADQLTDPEIKKILLRAASPKKIDRTHSMVEQPEQEQSFFMTNSCVRVKITEDQEDLAEVKADKNQPLSIERYLMRRSLKELLQTLSNYGITHYKPLYDKIDAFNIRKKAIAPNVLQPVLTDSAVVEDSYFSELKLFPKLRPLPRLPSQPQQQGQLPSQPVIFSARLFKGRNKVADFLNMVIRNNTEKVDQMLQFNPDLRLLFLEEIRLNLNGRGVCYITAYQYALLNNNKAMTTVMVKYLKAPDMFRQQEYLTEIKELMARPKPDCRMIVY